MKDKVERVENKYRNDEIRNQNDEFDQTDNKRRTIRLKDKVKPDSRFTMPGKPGSSIEDLGSVDVYDSNANYGNNTINENSID